MSNVTQIDHVTVRVLNHGDQKTHRVELSNSALLLDVLLTGAELAGVKLLPPGESPLDRLHVIKDGKVETAVENLDEPLDQFLGRTGSSHEFGIELLDVFAVNNRWAVAPKPELTPREILPLAGLSYEQFTLYPPHSDHMLALDNPVRVHRGERFEAQRDGKYGAL